MRTAEWRLKWEDMVVVQEAGEAAEAAEAVREAPAVHVAAAPA